MLTVGFLMSAIVLTVSSQSAVGTPSMAFEACTTKAESTQATVECYKAELAKWDRRLNDVYQQLMQAYTVLDRDAKLMSGRSRAQVSRAAQRKWLAFRDADCSADEVVTEGTVSRVAAAVCLLDHTVARVLKLERSAVEAREALLLLD